MANQWGFWVLAVTRARDLVGEGSADLLLNPSTAFGLEYRQEPNNLSFASEDDWWDVFTTYFPSEHLSLVAAYGDLGSIAGTDRQTGFYLSAQASF